MNLMFKEEKVSSVSSHFKLTTIIMNSHCSKKGLWIVETHALESAHGNLTIEFELKVVWDTSQYLQWWKDSKIWLQLRF